MHALILKEWNKKKIVMHRKSHQKKIGEQDVANAY